VIIYIYRLIEGERIGETQEVQRGVGQEVGGETGKERKEERDMKEGRKIRDIGRIQEIKGGEERGLEWLIICNI
jgi:hypothetical protein